MNNESFVGLIERVRAGDESAIRILLERYGPHIRRIARVRLQGSRMRRLVESADICQSVMANFCQRAVDGQFELETPGQLLALLGTMTRNQVLKKAAFHQSQRRDIRRQVGSEERLESVPNRDKTPSLAACEEELMDRIRELLTDDERYLLEQRADGRSWVELAGELGLQPDGIRKRATRAAQRLAACLQEHREDETRGS